MYANKYHGSDRLFRLFNIDFYYSVSYFLKGVTCGGFILLVGGCWFGCFVGEDLMTI